MTDFPTLLYTSTSEIPTLSYTLSLAEPPRIGHHREYCLKFLAFSLLCLFKGDVFAETLQTLIYYYYCICSSLLFIAWVVVIFHQLQTFFR